jgi:splicing factor 1
MKVVLPPSLSGRSKTGDASLVPLYEELADIDNKLRTGEIQLPPEHERSPSPPPIYDANGIRQNTRDVRMKEKMASRRNMLIEELIKRDESYKPPTDWKPEKKTRKVYIPYKEHPGYNFIGLIIGPRGNTQKKMQNETNCRIAIRGRGSVKEGVARNPNSDYGEEDELHVLIVGDTDEDVDRAAAMVEKLCQPMDEEMNEHKKLQLRELALINGTLKEETEAYCMACGEPGHRQIDCPKKSIDVYQLPSEIQVKVDEQYAKDVARMNPGEAYQIDSEYTQFLAELGGYDPRAGPPPPTGRVGSKGGNGGGGGGGGNRGERGPLPESCKLYVGNLAPTVTDQVLRELFQPFGHVLHVAVLYDQNTGSHRGFGFVHFADEGTTRNACDSMQNYVVQGRPLSVRVRSDPMPRAGGGGGMGAPRGGGMGGARPEDNLPPGCKLFVGSVPYHIDEFTLRREFERFGAVVGCRIPTDRETGRQKPFGFVSFSDPQVAAMAISYMDGFAGFDGNRPLTVRIAGDKGGGGGRGGGRGSGSQIGGQYWGDQPGYDEGDKEYQYNYQSGGADPGFPVPPPPSDDYEYGMPPPPPPPPDDDDVPPPPPPPSMPYDVGDDPIAPSMYDPVRAGAQQYSFNAVPPPATANQDGKQTDGDGDGDEYLKFMSEMPQF